MCLSSASFHDFVRLIAAFDLLLKLLVASSFFLCCSFPFESYRFATTCYLNKSVFSVSSTFFFIYFLVLPLLTQTLQWKPHRTKITYIDCYRNRFFFLFKKRKEERRRDIFVFVWLLNFAKSSSSIRLTFFMRTKHSIALTIIVQQIIITDGLPWWVFLPFVSVLFISSRSTSRSRSPTFSFVRYVRLCVAVVVGAHSIK